MTINDGRNASAGGIIGSANNSIIASCYAQGAITIQTTTTANGGGIVGDLHEDQASSLIMACRADGNIHAIGATVNTGGLAGVTNGILSIFLLPNYSITTQSRLWVLFDTNSPWSNTVQGGTNVYPVPVMSYIGQ